MCIDILSTYNIDIHIISCIHIDMHIYIYIQLYIYTNVEINHKLKLDSKCSQQKWQLWVWFHGYFDVF